MHYKRSFQLLGILFVVFGIAGCFCIPIAILLIAIAAVIFYGCLHCWYSLLNVLGMCENKYSQKIITTPKRRGLHQPYKGLLRASA